MNVRVRVYAMVFIEFKHQRVAIKVLENDSPLSFSAILLPFDNFSHPEVRLDIYINLKHSQTIMNFAKPTDKQT